MGKGKSRLGADPLGWITKTDRKEEGPSGNGVTTDAAGQNRTENGAQGKHDLTSKQGKQNKRENPGEPKGGGGKSTGNAGNTGQAGNTPRGGHDGEIGRDAGPPEPETAGSTRRGLRSGWIRATFIVREEHAEKIRKVAWWERKKVTEVIEEALSSYLEEKKPGED